MIDDKHLQLSKGSRLTNVTDDENNEALLKFSAHWQVQCAQTLRRRRVATASAAVEVVWVGNASEKATTRDSSAGCDVGCMQDRFWFALMIWMWFVAFIAAQAAIEAVRPPAHTLS